MGQRLYVGMGPRGAVGITVAATDTFDPSTVTAATFQVTKPDGTTLVVWPATIAAQSTASISLTYQLASGGGDLDQPGVWRIWALMTVPGGQERSVVGSFPVLAQNQL